jgi:hypothetical protein
LLADAVVEAEEVLLVDPEVDGVSLVFGLGAVEEAEVEDVEAVVGDGADAEPDFGTLVPDDDPSGLRSPDVEDGEEAGLDAKELVDEPAFGSSFFSGFSGVLAATFSGFRSIVTGRLADVPPDALPDGLPAEPAEPGFESVPEVDEPDVPEPEGEDVPLA